VDDGGALVRPTLNSFFTGDDRSALFRTTLDSFLTGEDSGLSLRGESGREGSGDDLEVVDFGPLVISSLSGSRTRPHDHSV